MFQVENRQELGNVNFMKELVKEFAEDKSEDQNFISKDKVEVKHQPDDAIGDEFAEDIKNYETDGDEAGYGFENEVCERRDLSDDEYDPDSHSVDLDSQDSDDSDSPKKNRLKSRKEKRGRPPKSITDPKMCSDTRQRKVKHFRVNFKEWCAELGCEVNQLNGIFLYLSNICAKCAKLDLANRGNICTDGTRPELAKIGWEISHFKLCSVIKKPRIEEMKAMFEEWCSKLECRSDQLNGLFLYLNNIRTTGGNIKVAMVGKRIFKDEPLNIENDSIDSTTFIERVVLHGKEDKVEEPKFMCTTCGKRLMTQKKLLAHEREHSGILDTCDICGQRFAMANALAMHKAQMHKKVPYPGDEMHCCDKCGKQYGSKESLTNHIQHVHGELMNCKVCDFSTRNRQVLSRHIETHGEPKFKCSTCGKMFRKKNTLIAHELQHAGIVTCNCSICGKGFTHTAALGQHRRLVHKIVGPNAKPSKRERERGLGGFSQDKCPA